MRASGRKKSKDTGHPYTESIASASPYSKLKRGEAARFRADLLAWYDRHRRHLPWRAGPGMIADPYHVWLSEIMLQQTVVAAVIPYFTKFVEKWPTVHDLANAPPEDVMKEWAGLGYYARARNMVKCAQTVSHELNGRFPDAQEELKTLPGIGDYTSAAIAAIAFDRPATVVDGNVDRVVARYAAITEPFPAGKKAVRAFADQLAGPTHTDRPGDFAQAMMDLGATVCIPKAARCTLCPVAQGCRGRAQGIQNELPRKAPRKAKPRKHGYVYWITDGQGRVLLYRRPEDMMMGGMMALPTSSWVLRAEPKAHDLADLPVESLKIEENVLIQHSFTHFDLELQGCTAILPPAAPLPTAAYMWHDGNRLADSGFPSLFLKAFKQFSATLEVTAGKKI